jgi:hypothetical protein
MKAREYMDRTMASGKNILDSVSARLSNAFRMWELIEYNLCRCWLAPFSHGGFIAKVDGLKSGLMRVS